MSENPLPGTPQGQPDPQADPFVQPGVPGGPNGAYGAQQQPPQQYAQTGQNYQYAQQQNYQYAATPTERGPGIGSPQKDKWVAAVLAFLLGTLGIHKFYLGYKNAGIAMLVISLVGGLCFGIGWIVMAVISLIEAVKYVILTQEDFERIYLYGSKGWF
jgi:TM2 domain-containing membrane protein YozV